MDQTVENFEKALEVEKNMIATQLTIANRIDAVCDIRAAYDQFMGMLPTMPEIVECVGVVGEAYTSVKMAIDGLTFEQFDVEPDDFDNPVTKLIPNFDPDGTDFDMFKANLTWHCVGPFGERINRLYMAVQHDKLTTAAENTEVAEEE